MRISIVIDHDYSKVDFQIAEEMLASFVERGYDVQLISFQRKVLLKLKVPDKVQLIVLDSFVSPLSAIQPTSGLRKWFQSIKHLPHLQSKP